MACWPLTPASCQISPQRIPGGRYPGDRQAAARPESHLYGNDPPAVIAVPRAGVCPPTRPVPAYGIAAGQSHSQDDSRFASMTIDGTQ